MGLSLADIYPNVGIVAEPQLNQASGGEIGVGRGTMVSWLGILLIIIAWRVIIELAEEV